MSECFLCGKTPLVLPDHLSTAILPSGRIAIGADEVARGEGLRHTLLVVGKAADARALARSLLVMALEAERLASEMAHGV